MNKPPVVDFRKPVPNDLPILEQIRLRAFAPIFESFRSILGDTIYEAAQKSEDEQQERILAKMFEEQSQWLLYVAESGNKIVGFISLRLNQETRVGEIGLNAVDPAYSRKGIGTRMYQYGVSKMRESGMQVVVVATGGDSSHAAARRAYQKAGFNVSIPSLWMCQELDEED